MPPKHYPEVEAVYGMLCSSDVVYKGTRTVISMERGNDNNIIFICDPGSFQLDREEIRAGDFKPV